MFSLGPLAGPLLVFTVCSGDVAATGSLFRCFAAWEDSSASHLWFGCSLKFASDVYIPSSHVDCMLVVGAAEGHLLSAAKHLAAYYLIALISFEGFSSERRGVMESAVTDPLFLSLAAARASLCGLRSHISRMHGSV